MQFDRFTAVLLILRPDAPVLDDEAAAALQDAHMSHLADLYDAGVLLAVGPLFDDVYRGLSIFSVGPEDALAFANADPAVQSGRFSVKVIPWMIPGGLISFTKGRLPRSMAETDS